MCKLTMQKMQYSLFEVFNNCERFLEVIDSSFFFFMQEGVVTPIKYNLYRSRSIPASWKEKKRRNFIGCVLKVPVASDN